ncbi:MAG: sulfatase family protein [Planctomycetota bacterium]|jgi:arylsulfatase A-like enzyme
MKKYNVIYIHSHDTGRYIQPYGHAVETPKLQELAEEGVLFRQAFTVNPTCSPSRAALLTGMYPHSNGMFGLAHRGFRLNDYKQHMLHTLKAEGYHTALSGVQHVIHQQGNPDFYKEIGYDEWLTPEGRENTEYQTEEFLDNIGDKPFFLAVGFFETHRVFPEEHPRDDSRYTIPPSVLPDTAENREDMARFKGMARMLDEKMGRIFDAVKKNNLEDNTIIICTTDHGIAFPRMKCNLQDSGTGIMLLMKTPDSEFRGGKVIDSMVSHVDIFPTLCEILEIDKPDWLQGVSFLPAVRGEKEEVREELFTEINFHATYEPMRSVRTKRHKYIRRYHKRNGPALSNCDDGLSKDTWLKHGWEDMAPVEENLFDLVFDPNENNNLADQQSHKEILADLSARLDKWMKETNDPLCSSDEILAPEGAIVNELEAGSPGAGQKQMIIGKSGSIFGGDHTYRE